MKKKPYKEKNDLSIESSEMTHMVSLDANNWAQDFWESGEKSQKKAYSWLSNDYVNSLSILQTVLLS